MAVARRLRRVPAPDRGPSDQEHRDHDALVVLRVGWSPRPPRSSSSWRP